MNSQKNPVDIFNELEKIPGSEIEGLWPHQEETLKKYFGTLKDKRNVAIELPTGSGKSLIALLIAEMWRRDSKRVIILASSKALADDLGTKADAIGIPNVIITGKKGLTLDESFERGRSLRKYKRNLSICIMNYWAYLYAKDIQLPEILLIDDAHSFENLLYDYYKLRIKKQEYEDLWDTVCNHLESNYKIYPQILYMRMGLTRGSYYCPVAFSHAQECVNIIKEYFLKKKSEDKEPFWDYLNNVDKLDKYLMYISKDSIVFTPYVTPISGHPMIKDVNKIIFFSATFGSYEVFFKSLGSIYTIHLFSDRDLDEQIGTMGKRLIFPLAIHQNEYEISNFTKKSIEKICDEFKKVLIFTNSFSDTEVLEKGLKNLNIPIMRYVKEEDTIRFSEMKEGILIATGRFIGLDLPGDICKVAILTKTPNFLDPNDFMTRNILNDNKYSDEKVAQRLVQSFGRCNRKKDDIAVYFTLDETFESEIDGIEKITPFCPTEIMAQMDIGHDYCQGSLDEAIKIGVEFLQGKFDSYEDHLKNYKHDIGEREIRDPEIVHILIKEIDAWNRLINHNNFSLASKKFIECAEFWKKYKGRIEYLEKRSGWFYYLSAMANYLEFYYHHGGKESKKQTIANLEKAIEYGTSAWFSNLKTIVNELKQEKIDESAISKSLINGYREKVFRHWSEFKRINTRRTRDPEKKWNEIKEKLANGSHAEVCMHLKTIFNLLGFEVRITEDMKGEPDLICFANETLERFILLVEVKMKLPDITDKSKLCKGDVDQANGNVTRYKDKYVGFNIYPIIYMNKEASGEALENAKNNVNIINEESLLPFLDALFSLMNESYSVPEDAHSRIAFLESIPPLKEYISIFKPKKEPIICKDEMLKIFKK